MLKMQLLNSAGEYLVELSFLNRHAISNKYFNSYFQQVVLNETVGNKPTKEAHKTQTDGILYEAVGFQQQVLLFAIRFFLFLPEYL